MFRSPRLKVEMELVYGWYEADPAVSESSLIEESRDGPRTRRCNGRARYDGRSDRVDGFLGLAGPAIFNGIPSS